jgi:ABC-2 type transport system ATP-binding protein
MEVVLRVKNLRKLFGNFAVVDGISFEVKERETVGLIGPNGAGKTTTIQMILGLIEPTWGEIEIFGKNFKNYRERILERTNFAATYVWFPDNLTVKQNLMIFSMLYGQKPSKDKIEELLLTFDLKKFENQKAGKLSSGERVRLNLAKAFVNDPKLLLLDEPTASLDPAVSFKVREIIKERQASLGTAILWTSHNMREIENVCDRVIFINKGKIVAQGTPDELRNLFKKQDLEEIFISLVKS